VEWEFHVGTIPRLQRTAKKVGKPIRQLLRVKLLNAINTVWFSIIIWVSTQLLCPKVGRSVWAALVRLCLLQATIRAVLTGSGATSKEAPRTNYPQS